MKIGGEETVVWLSQADFIDNKDAVMAIHANTQHTPHTHTTHSTHREKTHTHTHSTHTRTHSSSLFAEPSFGAVCADGAAS